MILDLHNITVPKSTLFPMATFIAFYFHTLLILILWMYISNVMTKNMEYGSFEGKSPMAEID